MRNHSGTLRSRRHHGDDIDSERSARPRLFGHINRTGLAAIVLAIWVFQLALSPIRLEHFRFGPAEWTWRSLTYWRLQPMRVNAVKSVSAVTVLD